ncbi:threonine synthase [Aliifodinibius salipaludis]|uniref:Threonine synthase n=1 Tax=Fodinibius salipaludis TaxID=2032627 RepID=A0A2A2G9P7_9BACT|nr:threonine synthase [Aliifodinibius salipaludis]PAU93579.1 threonine synthase [Aliifodinibius salipaludis]
MKYISTNKKADPVSFAEAALKGLAPDGGLYLPQIWPRLSDSFLDQLSQKSLQDIGFKISRLFVDGIDDDVLEGITKEALNFDVPLNSLGNQVYVLELFHGPTLAFKDFGARFMSRIFSALRKESDRDLVILAATSGDTGSAVAQGFLSVEGIKVCLLYPKGKVSYIQEQQLTTAGQNVTALEVEGTFDDCQRMVKEAFSDYSLNEKLQLSSANSINIARLIPQMFYYFYAIAQLSVNSSPIFCVPSGNFGNLTAGLMAQKMGMSATGFIAATNANDVVPEFLDYGEFNPRPSKRTISNAMDVGNPSNFARIVDLLNEDYQQIKRHIWGASFSDSQTRQVIKEVYRKQDYLMDPHTAVGYRAVQQYISSEQGYFSESKSTPKIILSTAHPAKFKDVIEPIIGKKITMPDRLKACLNKQKQSHVLEDDYDELKKWLLNHYN